MSNLGDTIFTTTLNTNIIEETHLKYNSSTPTAQHTGAIGQHLLSDGSAGFKWGDVPPVLTPGTAIAISNSNVISANYTAGTGIIINGSVIKANYTAGAGIAISNGDVISTSSINYTAGTGININGSVISGNYTQGTGITISGNVISASSGQLVPLTAAQVKSFHQSESNVSITNGAISTITSNDIVLKASNSKKIKFEIGTNHVMTHKINVVGRPAVGIGMTDPVDVLEILGRLVVHPDITQQPQEGGEILLKDGTNNDLGDTLDGWHIDEYFGEFRVFSQSIGNSGYNPITMTGGIEQPGTQKLRISANGRFIAVGVYEHVSVGGDFPVTITTQGTVRRSSSSRRFKKNIETMEDSYADALLDMRPVWFRSKMATDNTDHDTNQARNADWGYWGFIAEEVAEVDPRLALWETHKNVDYYEEGSTRPKSKSVKHDKPIIQSVAYDRMIPHLVNLAKRQRDAIQDLTARLEALESK
jgi:hypothetical protein